LKTAVADALNRLLDPIRKAFAEDEEAQKIEKLAYPDPNAKEKKRKKVCPCRSYFVTIFRFVLQPKLYHPPPPNKGKNAEAVNGAEATAGTEEAERGAAGIATHALRTVLRRIRLYY